MKNREGQCWSKDKFRTLPKIWEECGTHRSDTVTLAMRKGAPPADCEDPTGRHIEYWLVKPGNAIEDQPYVVFEKQTDHSLAPPDGVSPLDYSGENDKFDDDLRPGVDGQNHDSFQIFRFGLQGQRLYDVKRIHRQLVNSDVPVDPPKFHIQIPSNGQATLNSQSAPYVGPCENVYPPN